MNNEYGAVLWNEIFRRKPVPVPLCPPQIPLDQTRAGTRAVAVGSQRLIAWAMARPDPWKVRSFSLFHFPSLTMYPGALCNTTPVHFFPLFRTGCLSLPVLGSQWLFMQYNEAYSLSYIFQHWRWRQNVPRKYGIRPQNFTMPQC
jgi:hypothetical protein